jgi:thioredoxin-related protein
VVALLLSILLVKQFFFPTALGLSNYPQPTAGQKNLITRGTKVTLSDIDWSRNGRTLLLILQKGCHFCTESASFYQQLTKLTAGRNDIRLVAVLPQEINEAQNYLKEIGVSINEIKQAAPTTLGAHGTPTLILTDAAGIATDIWVGKLTSEKEAEVISRLQSKA